MLIFQGFWSTKWLDAHQSLVLTSPIRDPKVQETRMKNQDQWLASVARFVMCQAHQLWTLWNNEHHGTTPAKRETRLRVTTERELVEMYAHKTSC
jgi:hypothetical protein